MTYRVADAQKGVSITENVRQALYREAQLALQSVKSQLVDARDEGRQFQRERDEALGRVREMQVGLDEAIRSLQGLKR